MDNEKIARQLVEMAQSLEGKNGMKRNAGGRGRDDVSVRELAKDLEKIGKEADRYAEDEAEDEYEERVHEIDYFWTKEVNINIQYSGNSEASWDDDGISYIIREDGLEIEYDED